LTNPDGTPVANSTYNVTFKIYENGAAKIAQNINVATLGGVFSVFLNVSGFTFNSGRGYQLGVTFNGNETKHAIASVPVAQVAKQAESFTGPGTIPVGGVIMWWSDGTLPAGWAVCDGSVVSNPASPLNGKTLPDLRNKFVRGVANSNLRTNPMSGGANVDNHTHSIGTDGNHSHTVNNHTHSIANDRHNHDAAGGGDYGGGQTKFDHNFPGHTDTSAYEHNHGGGTGGAAPGTDAQGNHSHGGATGASSTANSENNVPAYIGLVYIIRIF
ncbi:MAG: phage tail protein, partial [Armatimonadota bacterium]|nr:phage tail protein [Armatimonadota bacterium]